MQLAPKEMAYNDDMTNEDVLKIITLGDRVRVVRTDVTTCTRDSSFMNAVGVIIRIRTTSSPYVLWFDDPVIQELSKDQLTPRWHRDELEFIERADPEVYQDYSSQYWNP